MADPVYQRILLKLGGEVLAGDGGIGIDPRKAEKVAARVEEVRALGVQIAIVIGAGNLWRGLEGIERGMERATADYMGMLGTVMNSLALMDALERGGSVTRVMSAIEMRAVAEPYIRRRAMEIEADIVIKATKVDGVYDADPQKKPDAKRFDHLTYIDALSRRLEVMDSTAISLCMDNQLPILVLDMWQSDSLTRAVLGKPVGTEISDT